MKKRTTTTEHLKNALQRVKGLIVEVVDAMIQDVDALDAKKQDKTNAAACTIPSTGWVLEEAAEDYPYYWDLAADVTAADRADIQIAPAGLKTAVACGMCPTCETLKGKIRIRAASVPAASMTAHYWIEKGA